MKGFLKNKTNFILNTDLFLSHHYNVYVEKLSRQSIRAYEVDLTEKRKHILSTLGEYFEREILLNENPSKSPTVIATNLLNGTVKEFDTERIIFFKKFVDSSGMASHRQSRQLIWTAYKEFFERQSFIANYLFHTQATKIVIDKIEESKKLEKYLKNFLDNIIYYNISLNKKIFVILAIGYGKIYKAVGLGTSCSIKKALVKAQKEMLQYFATSHSKYSNRGLILSSEEKTANKDIYHDNFDKLNPLEIKKAYEYLEGSAELIIDVHEKTEKYDTSVLIKQVSLSLGMAPFVAMFESGHANGVKVVKIFDFNWFPHMAPKEYTEEIFFHVGGILGLERKNFSKLLPFP